MIQYDAYWGRRALDFVDASEAAPTVGDVLKLFELEISQIGFSSYIMAGIPTPGVTLNELTLVNGWPKGWLELYTAEDYLYADPIPAHCSKTVNPFEWSEATFDPQREPGALTVMQRAHDFQLN